jgi:Zn-dependent M28 family amino/carboxypeptidase
MFTSPNVLGLIPGSDPALRDEVVILMAHLDHVGVRETKGGDGIINGAMDNAAGVAIVLEVARTFASSETRPRRSILFLAVTGEESGLLGTFYFASHPPVSLERIVGVVNLDMPLLTFNFTDIVAFGAEHSTLGAAAAKAAAAGGAHLSPDPMPAEGIFTRSDHYALVRKGVPALFMTPGFEGQGETAWKTFLGEHYHQPSDDLSQPFNWPAAARFAQITCGLVRDIANATERPRWNKGDFFGDTFAPAKPR